MKEAGIPELPLGVELSSNQGEPLSKFLPWGIIHEHIVI